MKRKGVGVAALASLLLSAPTGALAAEPPPGAVKSDNLEYVRWVPDTRQVVEGKFDEVRGRDVLILTGRFGFKTLDVSDPTDPQPLDSFIPADLAEGGYWQNEDMEIDTRRKLIIGALDPRHTDSPLGACPPGGSTSNVACKSGFYVISYRDPANLKQIGDFVELPSGHTSTCIQGCRYIWTGGPARRDDQDWLGTIINPAPGDITLNNRLIGNGRPIWVTDLSDPAHPQVSDEPVDLWRNDQYTDYSHDVDEDERGIAWVAGRGGIRGYATSGRHRDPFQNRWRSATPFDPILVAGGGLQWDDPTVEGDDGVAQATMFMHNSGRPTDRSVGASGVERGNVLIGTEEDFTTPCGSSGRIVASDLTDSWGGEPAQRSTRTNPYRMKTLDSFHPFIDTPETANPSLGCSAHYFEIEGPLLGAAWYGQGLRLVDIHDARNLRQVGYYRVTNPNPSEPPPATNPSSNSWDMEFKSDRRNGDLLYLFDMSRGVEVLRLKKGAAAASRMRSVIAPSVRRDPSAAKPVSGLAKASGPGGSVTYVCPLFAG